MRRFAHAALTALLLAAPAGAATQKFQKVPKGQQQQPPAAATVPANVDFVGNASFTPAQLSLPLTDALNEIQQHGLTKPRADDAAYFTSVFYRKQGYPDADVRWDIRGERLVLTVKEGPRTMLGKITYQGNARKQATELDQYMIGETSEAQQKQAIGFPFVEADVQTGVARVRGLYESEGHLDAVIDDAVITWSADRTRADVLVKIVEGPRYAFAAPGFTGPTPFTRDELIEGLRGGVPKGADPAKAPDPLQSPYTTQRVNTMQHNLEYFFKLKGYYVAEVTVQAEPKKAVAGAGGVRRVPVTFTIKAGPLYRFDGVTIAGLDRLHPSFIENRFRGLHGQPYSPPALDEKYREVLRTGLFRNLRMTTVPLPDDEVRIDLTGEEAKAKEIGFSIGFSTYEGALLGVRLADRDFMGRGRPLSLDIDYTSRAIRTELLYVDPWLFESNYALRARLFLQSRTEEGYTKQEEGLRGDLTRKFSHRDDLFVTGRKKERSYETSAFFSFRNVEITEANIQPQFLGPTSYQIATLGLSQTIDLRDNPINPSRGIVFSTAFDVDAIASEAAFARTTARITYFLPILQRYLLAAGVRGGVILPFTVVPIDERFFNGGSTTVRSFTERHLGPEDPKSGNPIGGEAFTVFNVELEIPIKDALSGAVFFDAGNVSSQYEDVGLKDLRYGIGVGVRYKLPIGPVRLDVGVNPTPKMNEDWGAVHFSFGFAF